MGNNYIKIGKNDITIKKPKTDVFVFDGYVFVIDAKQKINIEAALQAGAKWRSTAN